MNIGERIRQLRISNDLTLEELASRCELTKGFLSQLENNISTPSLPALEDIVEVLGYTMSEFFSEADEEKIIFKNEDYFINEKEEYTITYIVPNAQKNEMEPIIIEILPNGKSEMIAPQKGEQFGYILKGCVDLIRGKKIYHLKEGETFYFSCDKNNYLKNTSKENCKVMWICTPPLF